jgi:hypothetical protein
MNKSKKPVIMTDFDNTMIKQNSLNILSKKIGKYYLKTGQIAKLLKNFSILWIRLKELYTNKKLLEDILIFDDSDVVIQKAKRLKRIPYSLYLNETVPILELNRTWILTALKLMRKYDLEDENIIIVSRNGHEEIEDFLDHENNIINRKLIEDKEFLSEVKKISGKKLDPSKMLQSKKLTNRDILRFFGFEFEIIANKLCKKMLIIDNKKDFIYTGIIRKTVDIGVIERKNKALLYENNIVIADKEEEIYKSWTKEFVCVEK